MVKTGPITVEDIFTTFIDVDRDMVITVSLSHAYPSYCQVVCSLGNGKREKGVFDLLSYLRMVLDITCKTSLLKTSKNSQDIIFLILCIVFKYTIPASIALCAHLPATSADGHCIIIISTPVTAAWAL